MHSLRRLTQSVVVRHPTVLAAIRPIVVSNPTASPPSSMPHMSPLSHYAFSPVTELPLHGRPFASLSGKEHSDSMETEKGAQKFKRSAADAQKASNQAGETQPLRPFGSNSEEIVAGVRSPIDPLSEVRAKRKSRAASQQTEQDIEDQASIAGDGVTMRSNLGVQRNYASAASASDREGPKERAPSLTEVDEDEQAEAAKEGSYSGPNYNK